MLLAFINLLCAFEVVFVGAQLNFARLSKFSEQSAKDVCICTRSPLVAREHSHLVLVHCKQTHVLFVYMYDVIKWAKNRIFCYVFEWMFRLSFHVDLDRLSRLLRPLQATGCTGRNTSNEGASSRSPRSVKKHEICEKWSTIFTNFVIVLGV